MEIKINRLMKNLKSLGEIGRDENNNLTRLAATNEDRLGRDFVCNIMSELELKIEIDKIGNIIAIWETEDNKNRKPIFTGSHIDTVIGAGIYDGCLGILSGLEVIQTLKENNFKPYRPIACCIFTNEEGVRFQPDMMGSLAYAKGIDIEDVLKTIGTDKTVLKDELIDIGYFGDKDPGFIKPEYFIELHIEQGPILDKKNISLGAVETLQGISWQEIEIEGIANHAGTTPMYLRKDAGYCAAATNVFLHELTTSTKTSVSTVGSIKFEPNAINVISSRATFTVDLRDPNKKVLDELEIKLNDFLKKLEKEIGVKIKTKQLVKFYPVIFDEEIVREVEKSAEIRKISCIRMTSGAGQDAQMMARICPTAMIFIPSKDGISHNKNEFSSVSDIENGANILLDVIRSLSQK